MPSNRNGGRRLNGYIPTGAARLFRFTQGRDIAPIRVRKIARDINVEIDHFLAQL